MDEFAYERYSEIQQMERMYFQHEIEEIILGMADVVHENRRLRRELEEASEYKQKYEKLLNQSVQNARDNSATLLKAVMAGVFISGKDGKANE